MNKRVNTLSKGLAPRLLAGQILVLLAGALTAGLVAAVIGPRSSTTTSSKRGTRRTHPSWSTSRWPFGTLRSSPWA